MGNGHLDFSATDRPPDEITDGLKHLSSSYRMSLRVLESWKSYPFSRVVEESNEGCRTAPSSSSSSSPSSNGSAGSCR